MLKKKQHIKVYLHNLKDSKKVSVKSNSTVLDIVRSAAKKWKVENPLHYSLSLLENPAAVAQELDDDLFYSDIKLQWPGDTVLFMLTRSARAKSISLSLGQLPTPASGAAARAPSTTLSNSTPLLGLGIGSLSNVAQRNTPSSSSSSSSVAAMMQPTPSNDLYPNLDNPQQYQQHQQQQHMSSMTMIPGGAPVDRRLSMLQTPMLGSPASAVSSSSSSSLSGFGHALADEATYSAMTGCSLRTPGASVMEPKSTAILDACNMQLFENPAREAHIRQALNCSLEHTVIAAVNEYLRWYEKREAALSQAKEAQWVEELAKTQSQRPSLPANATPVAASPLVPAQPRPISQPVLLPQTQTNLPLNPATSSGSLLSMPGAIEPQPRTLSYASDASMYPSSSLLLQQSLPQPQPPAYQPPPLPDIIQQSPELRNLCTIDRFEPARVLSAINELGTTDVSKIKQLVQDWTAFESMGFPPSLVRGIISIHRDTEARIACLEAAQQLTSNGFSEDEIFSSMQLFPSAQEASDFLVRARSLVRMGYQATTAKQALLLNELDLDAALKELGPP